MNISIAFILSICYTDYPWFTLNSSMSSSYSKLFHVRPVTHTDVYRADPKEIPRIFQVMCKAPSLFVLSPVIKNEVRLFKQFLP